LKMSNGAIRSSLLPLLGSLPRRSGRLSAIPPNGTTSAYYSGAIKVVSLPGRSDFLLPSGPWSVALSLYAKGLPPEGCFSMPDASHHRVEPPGSDLACRPKEVNSPFAFF